MPRGDARGDVVASSGLLGRERSGHGRFGAARSGPSRVLRASPAVARRVCVVAMEQDSSEAKLNVVTGATGQVGIELCQILVERGEPVRAVVLEGDPATSRLRELGVEVVIGDACDESSLCAGFAGADT
ncbi:MAG TPA: hypothetical protein ENK31_08450, partial [Nannocystis exedens]|nr:hypothetical protein [Nannocystis exedens]